MLMLWVLPLLSFGDFVSTCETSETTPPNEWGTDFSNKRFSIELWSNQSLSTYSPIKLIQSNVFNVTMLNGTSVSFVLMNQSQFTVDDFKQNIFPGGLYVSFGRFTWVAYTLNLTICDWNPMPSAFRYVAFNPIPAPSGNIYLCVDLFKLNLPAARPPSRYSAELDDTNTVFESIALSSANLKFSLVNQGFDPTVQSKLPSFITYSQGQFGLQANAASTLSVDVPSLCYLTGNVTLERTNCFAGNQRYMWLKLNVCIYNALNITHIVPTRLGETKMLSELNKVILPSSAYFGLPGEVNGQYGTLIKTKATNSFKYVPDLTISDELRNSSLFPLYDTFNLTDEIRISFEIQSHLEPISTSIKDTNLVKTFMLSGVSWLYDLNWVFRASSLPQYGTLTTAATNISITEIDQFIPRNVTLIYSVLPQYVSSELQTDAGTIEDTFGFYMESCQNSKSETVAIELVTLNNISTQNQVPIPIKTTIHSDVTALDSLFDFTSLPPNLQWNIRISVSKGLFKLNNQTKETSLPWCVNKQCQSFELMNSTIEDVISKLKVTTLVLPLNYISLNDGIRLDLWQLDESELSRQGTLSVYVPYKFSDGTNLFNTASLYIQDTMMFSKRPSTNEWVILVFISASLLLVWFLVCSLILKQCM